MYVFHTHASVSSVTTGGPVGCRRAHALVSHSRQSPRSLSLGRRAPDNAPSCPAARPWQSLYGSVGHSADKRMSGDDRPAGDAPTAVASARRGGEHASERAMRDEGREALEGRVCEAGTSQVEADDQSAGCSLSCVVSSVPIHSHSHRAGSLPPPHLYLYLHSIFFENLSCGVSFLLHPSIQSTPQR